MKLHPMVAQNLLQGKPQLFTTSGVYPLLAYPLRTSLKKMVE